MIRVQEIDSLKTTYYGLVDDYSVLRCPDKSDYSKNSCMVSGNTSWSRALPEWVIAIRDFNHQRARIIWRDV